MSKYCQKYFSYLYRCIGVFFPTELSNRTQRFKRLCNSIIAFAWLLAYVPMLPTLFGAFGRYGLECKTRKCTVINIVDDYGTPLGMNPKTDLGSHRFGQLPPNASEILQNPPEASEILPKSAEKPSALTKTQKNPAGNLPKSRRKS